MKVLSEFTSEKLYLLLVCLSMFLSACRTVSTQIATQLEITQTPIATKTETPLPFFRYTVFTDETCAQIAFNFNVSEQTIIDLNKLEPSCPIKSGQELIIPYPTLSNIPSSTPQPVEIVELTTALDFYRNQRKYTVTIATSHVILIHQESYDSSTPPPKIPEKPSDTFFYRAKIKEVSDIDRDGEQEYTVLLNECAELDCNNFVSYIRIYKYNSDKDEYYVFDEFQTEPEVIEAKISY